MLKLTTATEKELQLSSQDVRALKRMGLSKVDVEEVEELARSVARQIRAQMDLRGRFQSVNREVVLSEVKEAGLRGNVFGVNVKIDATVEKNKNIDYIKSSEKDVVALDESSLKSGRRPKRGVKLDLSAGLRFWWGRGQHRMHQHGALQPKIDKYHHGGRYGEDRHYDDYPYKAYHHDNFDDHYHYEDQYDHYDDHHHHYNDHKLFR